MCVQTIQLVATKGVDKKTDVEIAQRMWRPRGDEVDK